MDEPVIAQKAPYAVAVEAGQDYFWCRCGRSAKQPFCDGAHKGSGLTPLKFHAEAEQNPVFLWLQAQPDAAAVRWQSPAVVS